MSFYHSSFRAQAASGLRRHFTFSNKKLSPSLRVHNDSKVSERSSSSAPPSAALSQQHQSQQPRSQETLFRKILFRNALPQNALPQKSLPLSQLLLCAFLLSGCYEREANIYANAFPGNTATGSAASPGSTATGSGPVSFSDSGIAPRPFTLANNDPAQKCSSPRVFANDPFGLVLRSLSCSKEVSSGEAATCYYQISNRGESISAALQVPVSLVKEGIKISLGSCNIPAIQAGTTIDGSCTFDGSRLTGVILQDTLLSWELRHPMLFLAAPSYNQYTTRRTTSARQGSQLVISKGHCSSEAIDNMSTLHHLQCQFSISNDSSEVRSGNIEVNNYPGDLSRVRTESEDNVQYYKGSQFVTQCIFSNLGPRETQELSCDGYYKKLDEPSSLVRATIIAEGFSEHAPTDIFEQRIATTGLSDGELIPLALDCPSNSSSIDTEIECAVEFINPKTSAIKAHNKLFLVPFHTPSTEPAATLYCDVPTLLAGESQVVRCKGKTTEGLPDVRFQWGLFQVEPRYCLTPVTSLPLRMDNIECDGLHCSLIVENHTEQNSPKEMSAWVSTKNIYGVTQWSKITVPPLASFTSTTLPLPYKQSEISIIRLGLWTAQ